MSVRNNCIAALEATIRAAVTVPVTRDETRARKPTVGGLILLREGEGEIEQVIMSPLYYQMRHTVPVVLMVPHTTTIAAARATMDALMVSVHAAIVGNRTLGGVAEWVQPNPPSFEEEEQDGAGAMLAALLPVEIQFTAPDSPAG
jgi:hypothetical protein